MPIEGTPAQVAAELATAQAVVVSQNAAKAKEAADLLAKGITPPPPPADPTNPTPSILEPFNATSINIGANPKELAGFTQTLHEAGIRPEVINEIATDRPVSPAEKQFAREWRARHMADKEWVKSYMDGNQMARRDMLLCSSILAADVRPEK